MVPKPPRRVTLPSLSACHATPLPAAPKFLLSTLELPAQGTDTDRKAHTRKPFPASCAFGKLADLVRLCLGGDGKPIPSKQPVYCGLLWVFSPLFFLYGAVSALEQDILSALLVII